MYRFLLAILVLFHSSWATADNVATPVVVGGDDNLDACSGLGAVSGLNAKGDGFLAVRSGANVAYPLVDKLTEGREVYICNKSVDGKWLGVVYSHDNGDDCGVTSPVNPARPYKGPCKSGWVNARWIKWLAG